MVRNWQRCQFFCFLGEFIVINRYQEAHIIMEDKKPIRRGSIYYADLDPVKGSEQGGYRPVLILQNNTGNEYSPTIIIAARRVTISNTSPLSAEL